MIRIGVISDTHGEEALVRRAMEVFQELRVSRIIHCGDLSVPPHLSLFSPIPTDFVYGNCDSSVRHSIARAIEKFGGTLHDDFGSMELAGKKIAFLHGHNSTRLNQEIQSGRWDLVCCGHTHRYEFTLVGETVVLNPGSVQRRFETPSAAMVELPKIDVLRIPLESGFGRPIIWN